MNSPARLAVMVSGGGTNLQALLDQFNGSRHDDARVEVVIANRSGIRALGRASAAGVPSHVLSPVPASTSDDVESAAGPSLLDILKSHQIDLVVLAGYLKLVPLEVVREYRGRMINIHPALLPAFGGPGMYGASVHQAVLKSGARVSGATVHFVEEQYDEGPILAQWPVPVLADDTAERLAARVLRTEHILLPAAVRAVVRGEPAPLPADHSIFVMEDGSSPAESQITSLIPHSKQGNAESTA